MKIKARADTHTIEKFIPDEKVRQLPGSLQFNKVFNRVGEGNSLADMVAEIEKQGQKLARSLCIAELRYYRKMISEFLQQALIVTCIFEKDSAPDGGGKFRKYSLVKKINQKVDDLMKKVLEEESSHIEVLKMLDDIRGLLLDLTI